MGHSPLFLVCVLIWGSTWIAIKYQIEDVTPMVSVAYRFTLAAVILGLYCLWRRLPMSLPAHIHVKMALVGLSLYTLDYTFLYYSQAYLISAVVALMSSCIIYINVFLRRVLLGKAIRSEVLVGATLGIGGMAMIFAPQFSQLEQGTGLWIGIGLAMVSFVFASIGNVISERILDHGTPVVQMNFWAMSYALIFLYGSAWAGGAEFVLPTTVPYLSALGFLALFGSVLAFGAYMKLVGQIGSDKAAYVVLLYPLVALALSTLFESYRWTLWSAVGVLIVLLGNAVAMGKLRWRPVSGATKPPPVKAD